MTYRALFLSAACLATVSTAAADVDVFGITRLMPSRSPALEWNSAHWAKGGKRTLDGVDPQDPTGWSRKRGQTDLMEVDGAGMLRMGGPQARIYFMAAAGKPLFFRDVEVTGYFRRVGSDGATNGGFMVGVRSGPEGHTETGHCTANTYYAGIRYPGTWVFDKELDHPNDAVGKSGRFLPGPMPAGRWIGFKYLAYNLPGRNAVKLESYVDTVSNGNPVGGGRWAKLGEIIDEGNWTAPPGDCGYAGNTVVTTGGGAVLFRNTGAAEANYKMVSIREITVAPVNLAPVPEGRAFRGGAGEWIRYGSLRFGDRDAGGRLRGPAPTAPLRSDGN